MVYPGARGSLIAHSIQRPFLPAALELEPRFLRLDTAAKGILCMEAPAALTQLKH